MNMCLHSEATFSLNTKASSYEDKDSVVLRLIERLC